MSVNVARDRVLDRVDQLSHSEGMAIHVMGIAIHVVGMAIHVVSEGVWIQLSLLEGMAIHVTKCMYGEGMTIHVTTSFLALTPTNQS